MVLYGGDRVGFFLYGGYNLLGSLTNITAKWEDVTEETHTLGSSWREITGVGLKQAELTQQGFFDDGVGSVHEALSSGLGTAPVLCFAPLGNTSGADFYGFNGAFQVNYTRSPARGELVKAEANYTADGQADIGRILYPLTAAGTSVGNTTAAAIDFAASATAGGVAYLQVTVNNGNTATGLAVDVMHSPDNLAFTSWLAFAAVTSTSPSAQRLSSTAVLQRYGAISHVGATAATISHTFFVGLARARAS